MVFRGTNKIKIKIDEDTSKNKCEKEPHGIPASMVDGSEACIKVYKGNGEPLDEEVEVENISEGEATLKNEKGETTKAEVERI